MNLRRNHFLFSLVILWVLATPSLCSSQTGPDQDLEKHFAQFQKLQDKILKHGRTDANWQAMGELKNYFVSRGDVGARFLVGKLQENNREELAFLQSRPPKQSEEDRLSDWESTDAAEPKYFLCLTLADMYGGVGSDVKTQILQALQDSYTPSTFFADDIKFLNRALLSIGSDSVPILLALSDHEAEFARCNVSQRLDELGKMLSDKQGGIPVIDAPPPLQCKAPAEQRRASISAWKDWWEAYGRFRQFPHIPNLLQ